MLLVLLLVLLVLMVLFVSGACGVCGTGMCWWCGRVFVALVDLIARVLFDGERAGV